MRYIEHQPCGGPEVLQVADTARPSPRPGEVLIQVAAAGVNRPDVAQRQGSYPPPPDASPILGLEVAGTIVEVGEGVSRWQVGDTVCALTPGGGYAEFCATPAEQCLPIPEGLSLVEAASLPENYFTVWTNVFDRGRLQPGEHILIHGGSSGIGQCAIQLAKHFGATVYTTVGNADKAEFCRELGADKVYRYRDEDWAARLAEDVGKRGVDVILDMVGGDYTMKNLRALAIEGRLVSIAALNGRKVPDFDITPIMVKRLTFTGSTLRPRSVADKAAIAQALRDRVWPLFASGKLRTVVNRTFPLEDVREAHELMESSQHLGKIVLTL
ncbi:MAG: NAD(P)H-quinone oxidoreductase [Pigmentiphaga sp.]|nr:NAD(P)H-quinone oxidoreductase [Pigmentiphaga sp.]